MYVFMGVGLVLFKDFVVIDVIEYYVEYIFCKGLKDLGSYIFEGSCLGMVMLVYVCLCVIGCKGYEMLIDCGIVKVCMFV